MNMKYKDPTQPLRLRINDLMLRMTLEEKIVQMTQINREVATSDVMKNYFIGSIMSSAGSVPTKEASPKTIKCNILWENGGSKSITISIEIITPVHHRYP
uniref:Glycoside hydrolase family 3 C-terminal domain-containing protein n=1 Tax=Tanacetum cinerariifolium TaxID=118510 RepID=A0A6L2N985_TANCI|nr:glycoside hydrolase family 3 C-terminal domain-containing protein [Tanacetum cinerariifolium]